MPHPIRIAPSLLACDFTCLADEIRSIEQGGCDWLHLDVMDGHFVPNLTFGPPIVAAMHRVAQRPLDVHLMIRDPWQYRDAFLDAGADLFTFHVEVEAHGDVHALLDAVHKRGCKTGLSIQPDTNAERLRPYLAQLDLVLIMSVFAGFGGQQFMPEVLTKVKVLRDLGFAGEISMDGGIGTSTIAKAAAAGVNVFVAGTAVFGAVGGLDAANSRAPRAARIAALRALATAAQSRD